MVELAKEQFQKVRSLYRNAEVKFPLIQAVVENVQSGRIWVDDAESPRRAFILNRFGFAMGIDDGQDHDFNWEFEKLIFDDPTLDCGYMLWVNPPEMWRKKMDGMDDKIAFRRERIQYRLNQQKFERSGSAGAELPPGVEVKRIDVKILPGMEVFELNLTSKLWDSAEDFLELGIGYCAFVNGEPASICYAACVVDGIAEIDVMTRDSFKGSKLGTIVCRAFIVGCLADNIEPSWDCFDYNTSSIKLAERLGFEETLRYPFYSLNRLVEKELA